MEEECDEEWVVKKYKTDKKKARLFHGKETTIIVKAQTIFRIAQPVNQPCFFISFIIL